MSLHIVKVKLLNNGMKGMEYHAEAPQVKDDIVIKSFNKTIYPIPVPVDVRALIQRMKRYLLHMSGHWRKEYDQYILKGELKDITDPSPAYYELMSLFNNTRIEELSRFKGKYDITGFYLNDWKFPIKIQIKGVTIESGYEDYDKLDNGMKTIFKVVTDFVLDKKFRKMDAKQYMLDLWQGKDEMLQRLDGLDDDQISELQASVLEEKGFIVIKQEAEDNTEIDQTGSKVTEKPVEKKPKKKDDSKKDNPDINGGDDKNEKVDDI